LISYKAGGLITQTLKGMNMNEVILTSSIITIATALVAIIMAWLMLRLLDALGFIDFKTTIVRICSNETSAAVYFGLRFVGVCILFGMVLS
jgi:hypothetical protein